MKSPFFGFLTRSFYMKMILVMLGVSIIPLILLSYISISVSEPMVEKQINRLNEQLVNQVVDRIELTMTRLQELSEQYSRITSIQDSLTSPAEKYYEDVVRKKDLISVLSTASAVIGNVEGLQVYSLITGEVLSSNDAPTSLEDSMLKPLVEQYRSSGKTIQFLDKHSLPNQPLLDNSVYSICRIPFFSFEEMKGILFISMNNREFKRLIENIELGSTGSISLLTEDGYTIATTSQLDGEKDNERVQTIVKHWNNEGRPNQFLLDSSLISVRQTTTYDHWIVVSEIPSEELNQSKKLISRTVIYFLILLVAVGALVIFGSGYRLYRPLQAVRRQVSAIKKGDFDARVTYTANNEIGDLGRMLNSMAVRIQDLMEEQQEAEDLKRKLEIRALQSQINPHFLYNTLNTIRMFAMLKDFDKINDLMGRLVALLRYSMENFDQTVTLQQELKYLEEYVGLLNLRYKCQIRLSAEVEEPLLRAEIPKLSLQPLIENSVFHGILPRKADTGSIIVRVRHAADGEQLLLEVEDDGVGMTEEELEKLQAHLGREESSENIGLQNVYQRMRLMFGKETQIRLRSTPGGGTTIWFILSADTFILREEQHD
ncbi:cache domain-containing sensor histidine kinase [Gorillibacterium timonense]|uniref:cache domain-containing sensor histidine kinase n=1 Tax=Gorillibacterium timonense TaxID=1689269 RepID=UPI00071DB6E7|nr:sensor histidine kinase [Gorillibacterium timonense]